MYFLDELSDNNNMKTGKSPRLKAQSRLSFDFLD